MTPSIAQIRERLSIHEVTDLVDERPRAAVAAILRDVAGEPEILFIKRAEQEGDLWSGHMAFPGGWIEPNDESAQRAAERETREEIGLDLTRFGQLLGTLEPELPMMRVPGRTTPIAPFVYLLNSEPDEYLPNEEVAELHWAGIGSMLRHENLTSLEWNIDDQSRTMPGFDINGRTVWGLTFRILNRLLEIIDPDFEPPR